MIVKNYELNKINLNNNRFILFHGRNDGLKKDAINQILKEKKGEISNYEEKEILDNQTYFLENLSSNSLFESEKIIIIKRATDKIIKAIEGIVEKDFKDLIIIINSDVLEKKSKLRTFFEKNKKCVCIAFYPDDFQTLTKLSHKFFKDKKISISAFDINQIINKTNGDRETLFNELGKIEYYCKNGKKISTENINKIINLTENHSISELIDNCLAKNKKKIISILNENNFSSEDCILIIRTFLNKSKKILKLSETFESNNNIDLTISSSKPPIFWKDKQTIKEQLQKWTSRDIKVLIYKINEIEFVLKKNFNNSINLIINFILEVIETKNANNYS